MRFEGTHEESNSRTLNISNEEDMAINLQLWSMGRPVL